MSESPIGKLLEIANATPVWIPTVAEAYVPPDHEIARFEDLAPGLRVYVWDSGSTRFTRPPRWRVGAVHRIRKNSADRLIASVRVDNMTFLFYADRWSNYANRIARVDPNVEKKALRQAAKPMNFSGSKSGLIDGMTPDAILETYTRIQREQEPPYVITGPDAQRVPRLTPAQLICARSMWSARVKVAVAWTADEAARRERERVVVDDDRWEI